MRPIAFGQIWNRHFVMVLERVNSASITPSRKDRATSLANNKNRSYLVDTKLQSLKSPIRIESNLHGWVEKK